MSQDDQKLKEMQAQIDALRDKTQPKPVKRTDDSEAMSLGMRAGTELVGTILVAGAIGYGLDQLFETKPWIMVAMLVLGIIAAFYNVYKTTMNQGTSVGFKKPPET
ncbi:MAG TPA: AtpZ/AtpI family protein [Alphaproteobacteria bacterium]